MSRCRCCHYSNAWVMAPLCDRCFLGWNDCCEFRKILDKVEAEATEHTCQDMGFYQK